MQSKAPTVQKYLAELAPDRRATVAAVRQVILENLDSQFEEGMQYGMIGYYVPHSVFPAGYHCDPRQPLPFAGLASQKNHFSLYLMCLYGESDVLKWFRTAWVASGQKLDMGKACVRFKKIEDVALDVLSKLLQRVTAKKYIAHYESVINTMHEKPQRRDRKGVPRTKAAPKRVTRAKHSRPSRSSRSDGRNQPRKLWPGQLFRGATRRGSRSRC